MNKKERKEVRINVKVAPRLRAEFQIAAELDGATVSGLIHQFMVRKVHEKKQQFPQLFTDLDQAVSLKLPQLELNVGAGDKKKAASKKAAAKK